jgi:ribosomal protein S18 acetylase RimI-like enzyme
VKLALSVFGPVGLVQRLPRFHGRSKVDLPTPANSFYIAELDVDPLRRGEGIGGELLSWAQHEAQRLGITNMSLHTTTANPARHLYERHGFVVTQTAVDRRYEAYTGIAGQLLMERR